MTQKCSALHACISRCLHFNLFNNNNNNNMNNNNRFVQRRQVVSSQVLVNIPPNKSLYPCTFSYHTECVEKRCRSRTAITEHELARVTDGNDVDASSTCSHCFIPGRRRVVGVPIRHDHQVVGYIGSVSVTSLKHHVCCEPAKYCKAQYSEILNLNQCLTSRYFT